MEYKVATCFFFPCNPSLKITLLCLGEMFIQAQLSYVILLPSVVLDQGWNHSREVFNQGNITVHKIVTLKYK